MPIDSHLSESQQSHRNRLPVRGNSESDFGNGVIHPYSSRSNAAFDLLEDDLSRYTVKFLNFTENLSQAGRVCNNGICCNYNVVISEIDGEHQKVCFLSTNLGSMRNRSTITIAVVTTCKLQLPPLGVYIRSLSPNPSIVKKSVPYLIFTN